MANATEPNSAFAMWQRLASRPFGRQLFSAAMCLRVPYFATVLPSVRALRPGFCEVKAPKWWGVHNHIGTFHAIAACNLAEVAMGMLTEATVPTTHRWLPRGMTSDYVAKATTGLRAVAELAEVPEFGAAMDLPVPVTIYDAADKPVVRAVITIRVVPKPARTETPAASSG
jgi:acyl-coenzyme A thioesterase PaaI-like protein